VTHLRSPNHLQIDPKKETRSHRNQAQNSTLPTAEPPNFHVDAIENSPRLLPTGLAISGGPETDWFGGLVVNSSRGG